MSAALDTTIKTSTPHVVELIEREGVMIAACHCGQVLVRAPMIEHQELRARKVRHAMRNHLQVTQIVGKITLCLLFLVASWSCVMSEPAWSISRLSRLSDAQWRAFINGETIPPARKPLPHIEIDDIPNAAQAALVSMSFDVVAKAVTERLKQSTVRFGRTEFALLRSLGLCERQPDTIYHRLTDDGKGYARIVAKRIANELGMHILWTEIRSFKHEIAHCSCGWQRSLYSGQTCQRDRHHDFITQHLAEAAGASPRTYTDEALKRAIAAMDETFGQQRTEGT